MMSDKETLWQRQLLSRVRRAVSEHPFWASYIDGIVAEQHSSQTIHLAVFVEPYLQFILEGKKTVESRFSINLCPPHNRVRKGDVILLKKSGGAVVGVCQVTAVWFYELDPASWQTIRAEFSKALCADGSAFWKQKQGASFATLMKLTKVSRVPPVECDKRDRRGWVVLMGQGRPHTALFEERSDEDLDSGILGTER